MTRPDPFYVGYLPVPRAHALFLAVALPLALAGILAGAFGLAAAQPAWGNGFWQTGHATVWRGTLRLQPYPMLLVEGEPGNPPDALLLVEMGKSGTRDRFAAMAGADGASVIVRGRELFRDGRRMIEIDTDLPGEVDAGEPADSGPAVRPAPWDDRVVRAPLAVDPTTVVLSGEIVDSKCYLGAMKPGAGRGHKACATLCVKGGIPPVLVTHPDPPPGAGPDEPRAAPVYYLLADNAGRGLAGSDLARLFPVIAEPVALSGRAARLGSWRVLLLDTVPAADQGVPSTSP